MDNILKKISMVLISIFLSVTLMMGGYKLMQQLEYNEMVRIVKGEEVKVIIEEDLNDIHEGALKEGNSIYSYQIDEKSIRRNPMGGIMFRVILNSDENLVVHFTIQKSSYTGKIEYSGGGYTKEVAELIGEGE
jgi:hypothetical protein